jgi:asparagine synthase (glutamine-hydrolysing)
MCSILGIFNPDSKLKGLRKQALKMSRTQRHRGPDWSGIYVAENAILVHERLSIVDVESGAQPLIDKDRTVALAVNGEIYNHKELEAKLNIPYEFQTRSDCEVIIPLYKEKGVDFIDEINGIFAFVLYDSTRNTYLVARDHIGICPLFTGYDENGNFYVASEMKALVEVCKKIDVFPPGSYLDSAQGEIKKYYTRNWRSYVSVQNNEFKPELLRSVLESAVHRQLMSDVPYGVLLSGGLDSSIIAAIAAKFAAKRIETNDAQDAWWPRLHTFAIGLTGSPDLAAAREVSRHINSVHHEFHYTISEGLDALPDVIYHIESYDVTTVRASTPMYLMARKIKAMGVKMVLSGEGSDEIFGGYLYFHKAPNAQSFHEETVRKLDRLHLYDCLRANKSMAAWGVEARVPFLDKEVIDLVMNIDARVKMCGKGRIEKFILRETFADLLPASIVKRQKEQFSDGVGYSWIDSLKDLANREISDQMMQNAKFKFPVNTPQSKEEYFYRRIFAEHFPDQIVASCVMGGPSVACSTPEALEWDKKFKIIDPSGRAVQDIHGDAY